MLGIIGAMEEEVEQLKAAMEVNEEREKAGMHFFSGTLEGLPVTIVRSGIGKVNAAVCTQILIDDFHVDGVINTGIAGSLDAAIDIADVVIATDVLHHDMDATGFGYPKGQIPRMETLFFEADSEMASIAKEACGAAVPVATSSFLSNVFYFLYETTRLFFFFRTNHHINICSGKSDLHHRSV